MEDWTEYQCQEMAKLDDIGADTDKILKMIRGGSNMGDHFDMGMLTGLLSNKGMDPATVALLNDCKDKGWGDNGLLFLFLILLFAGGNGIGFGGNNGGVSGVDRTVINEANYTRLMDAMNTTGTRQEMAINSLASSFNCSTTAIQTALAGLDKQLAVNQGSVVNAIQSCCCNIQNAIQSCCCETNRHLEKGFCELGGQIQNQTYQFTRQLDALASGVKDQFCAQNAYLAKEFCDIATREDKREIQELRDRLLLQSQEAQTIELRNLIENRNTIAYTGIVNGSNVSGTGTLS